MTPEQQEQARRFVAWAGWEWQQRMEAIGPDGRFVVHGFPGGDGLSDRRGREWPAAECYPAIADDLTLSAIETLLRDRRGAVHVWCEPRTIGWLCLKRTARGIAEVCGEGFGRASALLAACEATP